MISLLFIPILFYKYTIHSCPIKILLYVCHLHVFVCLTIQSALWQDDPMIFCIRTFVLAWNLFEIIITQTIIMEQCKHKYVVIKCNQKAILTSKYQWLIILYFIILMNSEITCILTHFPWLWVVFRSLNFNYCIFNDFVVHSSLAKIPLEHATFIYSNISLAKKPRNILTPDRY